MTATILVFDSGLGGLTVFREVVRQRPDAIYVYCADDAAFPVIVEDHIGGDFGALDDFCRRKPDIGSVVIRPVFDCRRHHGLRASRSKNAVNMA